MSSEPSEKKPVERQTPLAYTRVNPKPRQHRARITLQDYDDMAQLQGMRLSEAESCAVLNIPVRSWRDHLARNRNNEIFQEKVNRIKGERIAAHLQNIAKFSEKDWRASECYLEKVEPARFSSRLAPEHLTINNNQNVEFLTQIAVAVYGDTKPKLPAKDTPQSFQDANTGVQKLLAAVPLKLDRDGNPLP